jgi:hypothetical protein
MNLFPYEPTLNLLPFDGIANYYGPILASCEAQDYFEALLTTVPWRNDEAVICGKRIITARNVACTAIGAFRTPIQERPRSRFPGRRNCEPSRAGSRRKLDACSIHVSAICTTTAAKAWAGTATTKRRSGKIPRLALSALALKGNFPFATNAKVTALRSRSNSRTAVALS